jgi:hypothetical protein
VTCAGHVFTAHVRANPGLVWTALTDPGRTAAYLYGLAGARARRSARDRQGLMSHCWQVLSSWAHWRTVVPLAVSQSSASRTMPLATLLMV